MPAGVNGCVGHGGAEYVLGGEANGRIIRRGGTYAHPSPEGR